MLLILMYLLYYAQDFTYFVLNLCNLLNFLHLCSYHCCTQGSPNRRRFDVKLSDVIPSQSASFIIKTTLIRRVELLM